MTSANIFDIKRFGINDGDGIRTVLFIKGCPLRCKWCQNPEGMVPGIRLWYGKGACVDCRGCEAVCAQNALNFDTQGLKINYDDCILCGKCIEACPTGALRFDAKKMTVTEAMREIEKDRVFYDGGGVTLSGGECTASPEFSLELLRACKTARVNTAIDTCLHVSPEILDTFAKAADMIIADIKLIDPDRHRKCTGVDNSLILDNIKRLAEKKSNVRLRVPLIPGYTADRENLEGIAAFIASLDADFPVQLLNFNPLCREKYCSLRQEYVFDLDQRMLSPEEMQERESIIVRHGLGTKI